MTWRHVTIALLVATALGLAIYDIVAVWRGGGRATISSVLLASAHSYPIIVLAIGVLLGHLFWPQREP